MPTRRTFLHLSLGAVAATTAVTLPHAAQGRIFPRPDARSFRPWRSRPGLFPAGPAFAGLFPV